MADAQASPRLRVAVLNRVFRTTGGGAESYSIRIAEQLAERHDIHVFAQEFEHEGHGITHHAVPCLFKRPRWLNQLWYALYTWHATRRSFDVVHSHENTWHGAIQSIHVWPVRSDLLGGGMRGWALALRWLKIAISPRLLANLALEAARFRPVAGRHIVASSETLSTQCALSYPRSAAALSVITPGVAPPGAGMTQAQAREALGLPATGAVILFVANDFARKGLAALLAALARLPGDVALAVAGAGSVASYRSEVRHLGLESRVRFLGPRRDMDTVYRAASVLAHPTLSDTFAMAVLEAMAYGVPAVVSGPAYCGISEMLRDGVDAMVLADPRDDAELAAALERVLQDADVAASLRARGREFSSRFSWEEAARQYEALYFTSRLA